MISLGGVVRSEPMNQSGLRFVQGVSGLLSNGHPACRFHCTEVSLIETPRVVNTRMASSTGAAIYVGRLGATRVEISAIALEHQVDAEEAAEPLRKALRPHLGTRTTKRVAFSLGLMPPASDPNGS